MKIVFVLLRERERERVGKKVRKLRREIRVEKFAQFEIIRNLKSKKEKGFWAWANDLTNCIDCPKLLLEDY